MIEPATIAQRLEGAGLKLFLDAVEGSLKSLFPDVSVRQHPGKIDVSDILEKDIFTPPMLAIAATRWKHDLNLDGSFDIEIEAAVYIVTEDAPIGGKVFRRQEIAHALSQGVLEVLGDFDAQRWGLARGISSPQKVEARPLFTSEVFAKGAAYYVVSWSQTLSGFGSSPLDRPVMSAPVFEGYDGEPIDDSAGAPV